MTKKWFVRKGILFLPVTFVGWLLLITILFYCVYIFIAIDSNSHSASDTLRNFIFNVLIVFVVYSTIGFFTSGNKN